VNKASAPHHDVALISGSGPLNGFALSYRHPNKATTNVTRDTWRNPISGTRTRISGGAGVTGL